MFPENELDEQRPLKHEELLARCLGNLEFAERVLATFQKGFEEDLSVLEEQCLSGNADYVASLAHRMKGASANTAAPRLQAQTARIEELARANRTDEIPRRLGQLKQEWSLFVESVASLESHSGAPA
jgi:HPt (histidine-containing phosphotransfer) domain-containing protein